MFRIGDALQPQRAGQNAPCWLHSTTQVEKGGCGRVRLQARRRQIQRRALTLSVSILSAARPESSLRCCDKVVVVAARPLALTLPATVDRLLPVARERDALMERAAALDSIVQCGRADAAQKSGCWNGADSAEANPASGQGPPRLGPAGGLLRTQVVTNGHTRIRARTSESLRYTEGFNGARDRYGFLPHRVISNTRIESTSTVYTSSFSVLHLSSCPFLQLQLVLQRTLRVCLSCQFWAWQGSALMALFGPLEDIPYGVPAIRALHILQCSLNNVPLEVCPVPARRQELAPSLCVGVWWTWRALHLRFALSWRSSELALLLSKDPRSQHADCLEVHRLMPYARQELLAVAVPAP